MERVKEKKIGLLLVALIEEVYEGFLLRDADKIPMRVFLDYHC